MNASNKSTYISLLRGINVSGKNLIAMKELRTVYEKCGFKNIHTYIQSGNVIFQYTKTETKTLEQKLQQTLRKETNMDVPFFIFELPTFKAFYENNPYLNDKEHADHNLYFLFLQSNPDLTESATISKAKAEGESFTQKENVVYLSFPNGMSKTKLTNTLFEKTFKTKGTIRNRNTVLKLIEIASSFSSLTKD